MAPTTPNTGNTSGMSTTGKDSSRSKVEWTGALDQAIGRARRARSKLFLFAFGYSIFIFLVLFYVLRFVFGAAFGESSAPDSWSLGAAFGLLLATSLGALAALDFFLIRPLRTLENINPQSSLGTMIASFFDKHAALESRFAQMAVEVQSLAGDRNSLASEINMMALRENVASSTLKATLSTTSEMLAIAEADGRIQDLSPPLQELLGRNAEDCIGHPVSEVIRLFDPDDPHPLDCPLPDLVQEALTEGTSGPIQDRAILVDANGLQHRVTVSTLAIDGIRGGGHGPVSAILRLVSANAGESLFRTAVIPPAAAPGKTDLLDRAAFERRATKLIEKSRESKETSTLLLLSIDRQDEVADRFGSAAGDALDWHVGKLVVEQVAETGQCFRLSGTHFAVLLPNIDAKAGTAVAEKIRSAVDVREFSWRDAHYDVSISASVVAFGPDCEGLTALLDTADHILLGAKANGGNQVRDQAASRAVTKRRRSDQETIEWMDEKIKQGRVHLTSQEIQPVGTNLEPLLETLVRVEDDDGVWVEPAAFLPALLRRNATTKLDLQSIQRVATALQKGSTDVGSYAVLLVNVSATSLADRRFTNVVASALKNSPNIAKRLGFEVDVLIAKDRPEAFERFVKAVKPLGASVALDRCKGAAGLNVMSTLPIDFVKIDASLVRKSTTDALQRSYVEWIQRAVRLLGKKTIAMGVSDQQSASLMQQVGVDYVQGTHINKMGPLIL